MYKLTTELWIRDGGTVKCQNRLCDEPCIKGFNRCFEHAQRELRDHENDMEWIRKYLIQKPYKTYKLRHHITDILKSNPDFLKEFPHALKQLKKEGWRQPLKIKVRN